MLRSRVFTFLLALLCPAATLLAQAPTTAQLDAEIKLDKELHTRAAQIVADEQARAKQPLCPKAQSTVDINSCYAQELAISDTNEVKLVRALGALLRVGSESPGAKPIRLTFDKAEATWQLYVKQACNADGELYDGGSIQPAIELSCSLIITRHHIDELWALYNDLGTH